MIYENVYFINGTAYAGKSTIAKLLSKKYDGILCEENYNERYEAELDSAEFPCLTYTRDIRDWRDFIRRTPDQYEAWIDGCTSECALLEQKILAELTYGEPERKIFVDTNIPVDVLRKIAPHDHVLIMLAEPEISVRRFFERPDREKQFLYRLLMSEPNPEAAMENFRECLRRINSPERWAAFANSGFNVIMRDEKLGIEGTLTLAERLLGLSL